MKIWCEQSENYKQKVRCLQLIIGKSLTLKYDNLKIIFKKVLKTIFKSAQLF